MNLKLKLPLTVLFFFIFSMALSSHAIAQGFHRLIPMKKILEKKKRASVKIILKRDDQVIAIGSGFFITSKGEILTHYKVIQPMLKDPSIKLSIQLVDSTIIKDVSVTKCASPLSFSVCLLKSNFKVKNYFKVRNSKLGKGNSVYFIGHCQSQFFSSRGVLKDTIEVTNRFSKKVFTTLNISNEICTGDIGAPIFSPVNGALLGMIDRSLYNKDKKVNYNLGFSVKRLNDFLEDEQMESKMKFNLQKVTMKR